MKKFIKSICLLLSLIVVASFCGCQKEDPKIVSLASIVYTEDLESQDNTEWKMVLVPVQTGANYEISSLGGAVLPDENGVNDKGEEVVIEKGDLIIMEFEESIYIRQETDPKVFIEGPVSIKRVSKNYSFEVVDGGYKFIIPLLDIYNGQIAKVDRNLEFYTYKSSEKPTETAQYSAIIEDISQIVNDRTEGFVTFFVPSDKANVVINSLAFGNVWVTKNG